MIEDTWAYIPELDKIIKYDEGLSPESLEIHPEWHNNIVSRGRKLVGLGYICGYSLDGNLWMFENMDYIYINK